MSELITLPKEELERLHGRISRLAREKSYLQLVSSLVDRLSAVPGLDNAVATVLRLVIDSIGGANVILYYSVEGWFHCTDVFGVQRECAVVDDELAARALATRTAVEETLDFAETRMTLPEFTTAASWAFPLVVGEALVGVLKLENVPQSAEVKERLQPFLKYVALVLKNEIENYAQIKSAHDQLTWANAELQESVGALSLSNANLEQAYKDLQVAQSRVLQQEKLASIGQLAAGVAHEINNPLGFVLSNLATLGKYTNRFIDFLRAQEAALKQLAIVTPDGGAPQLAELAKLRKALKIEAMIGDVGELIAESIDGGERMKQIVGNLKSFARVDDQGCKMADLNEGLESTLNIVWNELKYKAAVHKNYGDITPLYCNPGQLNQVFMNLLVNAAQAIEGHGEISLETREKDGWIFVTIADSGCGIPDERLNRIFEPFFTTKEVGKGTGLGLSIAYDIVVNKHGGRLTVASEVGKGSTFSVALPTHREQEAGSPGS